MNALTALSLVLLVAAIALWLRSYRVNEWVSTTIPGPDGPRPLTQAEFTGRMFAAYTAPGRLGIRYDAAGLYEKPPGTTYQRWTRRTDPSTTAWEFWDTIIDVAGVRFGKASGKREWECILELPFGCVTFVFALCPAAWLLRRIRKRPVAGNGLCATCGYDLRATPTRCPECGAAPKEFA